MRLRERFRPRRPSLKHYQLYTDGPKSRISSRYRRHKWEVIVRAISIRQAYRLLADQIAATHEKDTGVVELATDPGRAHPWPWTMPEALLSRVGGGQ
jgi:hypothetical protein